MKRFFILLLIAFVLTGCKNKEQSSESADEFAVPTLGIPMPTDDILSALGPENNISIQHLLPDPIVVAIGKPKQLLDSPVCVNGDMIVADTIVRGLQLYRINPGSIEQFVQSIGFSVPVLVNVPNPQNPMAMPVQGQIVISRRATTLTFHATVDKPLLLASILVSLSGINPDIFESLQRGEIPESLKRTEGRNEYYDLTPPNLGIPQRIALGMIDERTAVIVEGLEDDIKSVFSDTVPKNAILDRLKHTPIGTNDLILLTSLEGLAVSPEGFDRLLEPLIGMGVPLSFTQAVKKHLRALTLSVNVTATEGQPIVSIYAEGRDEESAKMIWETISGTVTLGQTALVTMDENAQQMLPIPHDFALSLLNVITVDVKGERVSAALNNFDTLIPTVNGWLSGNQAIAMQRELEERRVEQLGTLAQICAAYYTQNGKFPTDILDAEGKPLLSWRVALLPMMGLEELYNKFKLDEPWDSETNLELKDTLPMVFHPFVPEIELPKTVIRFFDSSGTPFSNRNLKIEDLENPQTTLMFIVTTPEYAVEWTKPESLAFDIDKIEQMVDNPFLGITFARQIYYEPILPKTDSRYEDWKRHIEALVKGMPLDASKPEAASLEDSE